MALTKELHESQIGFDATMMYANIVQQTMNFHVKSTLDCAEAPDSHGFEEVLKSLPVQKVKVFVDGVQRLMDQAKSLQDMPVETERQNERRKAQTRIEAERRMNEQQVEELMAENARLKARIVEGNSGYAAPSYLPATSPQAPQSQRQMHQHLQMGPLAQAQILQRRMLQRQNFMGQRLPRQQDLQALYNQQHAQELPAQTDVYWGPLHPSGDAEPLDQGPAPLNFELDSFTNVELDSFSNSVLDSTSNKTLALADSPGYNGVTSYSNYTSSSSSYQVNGGAMCSPARGRQRKRQRAMTDSYQGHSPGQSFSGVSLSLYTDEAGGEVRIPKSLGCAGSLVADMSVLPPTKKRKRPDNDPSYLFSGPASTDPSEDHQVKILSKNRVQAMHRVGTLYDILQTGQLVLKSGEPALGSIEL